MWVTVGVTVGVTVIVTVTVSVTVRVRNILWRVKVRVMMTLYYNKSECFFAIKLFHNKIPLQ